MTIIAQPEWHLHGYWLITAIALFYTYMAWVAITLGKRIGIAIAKVLEADAHDDSQ